MRKYSYILEVINDFGLSRSETELNEIKVDLKKLLVENHPDKNGGVIKNADLYYKVNSAIEFVNSLNSQKTVVPVNEYNELIKSYLQNLEVISTINEKKEIIESSTVQIKKRYWIPKISTGILFLISSFLFTFQKNFTEHPFFQSYYEFKVANNLGELTENFYRDWKEGSFGIRVDFREYEHHKRELDPNRIIKRNIDSVLQLGRSVFHSDIRRIKHFSDYIKGVNKEGLNEETKLSIEEIEYYFTSLEDKSKKVVDAQISFYIFQLWLLSILLYFIFWTREKSDSRYIKHILSDEGLKETMLNLIRFKLSTENRLFSKSELGEIIKSKSTLNILILFLGTKISEEQKGEVANHLIKKMIEKGCHFNKEG